MNLEIHSDEARGAAASGMVDPSTDMLLLPEPPTGFIRHPLYASIQSDGGEPLVTCHGILRHAHAIAETWATDPTTCILWTVKLTPLAMVGGEYFVPVPAFDLPYGWEIIASWSYATGAHALRTRAVSVLIPEGQFDWNHSRPLPGDPRLTTV